MPDYCWQCAVPVSARPITLHESCYKKLSVLWDLMQKSTANQRDFDWNSDELYPIIRSVLEDNNQERVFKVLVNQQGVSDIQDISDEYASLWSSLRTLVQQQNQAQQQTQRQTHYPKQSQQPSNPFRLDDNPTDGEKK